MSVIWYSMDKRLRVGKMEKKCHALKCSGMGVFEVAIFLDGSYFYGNYPNGK